MFYVPLYVEWLRARPALVFWLAALAQAAVWLLVPVLFYAAPPDNLAQLLAVGHELRFDSGVGPPLAYWLAEIAFRAMAPLRLPGLVGVYLLAQICVVTAYWCVFALGRRIVGPAHAALAVLLMAGISLFTVPSPDFGPAILTMALWAMVLLHYWQAVAQKQKSSWYIFGAAAALLLISSSAALLLLGALVVFTASTERGRAAFDAREPWIVAAALSVFLFVHLLWLDRAGDGLRLVLAQLGSVQAAGATATLWLRLLGALVLAHAGFAILLLLAAGWPRVSAGPAPPFTRATAPPFAENYVKVFAVAPGVLATMVAVVIGQRTPIGGAAPLLVLSGLAAVMAAGDGIALYHQRVLGFAWAGLLLVPAIFIPVLIVLLPWIAGTDLQIAEPANAMGRFFAESFERRTGQKLAIITGDRHTADLIAVAAPSRPSVFDDADPARSPWVTADDIHKKGAIVVWLTSDAAPALPPDIKAYFPDLVPELPRVFDRPVKGRLPLLRVGWGVIRPGSMAPAP